MELTVLEYAKKRGINKGYISRIVREGKLKLMPEIAAIKKNINPCGVPYYTLKLKPIKANTAHIRNSKKINTKNSVQGI